MEIKYSKSQHGFTLIELLVSSVLLGIIVVVSVNLFLSSLGGNSNVNNSIKMKQEGTFALNTIESAIRNADSASCATLGSLILTSDADTITFFIKPDVTVTPARQRLARTLKGTDSYLTSVLFDVPDLAFICTTALNKPTMVTINFNISTVAGVGRSVTQNFTSSASLRQY